MVITSNNHSAFTLVEVLIFITLIPLIFITLSYLTTYSLQNTKTNENKILATHYAEELREWLRGEKEKDWVSFNNCLTLGATYCVNTIPANVCSLSSTCSPNFLDNIFIRELTINEKTNTQLKFTIKIRWSEGSNNYLVPISTVFSLWE